MKKMNLLMVLSSLVSLSAASAFAQNLNCYNGATGAGLKIVQNQLQMNDALVAQLKAQGATQVVSVCDGGFEPSQNDPIQYEAGYPQGYSVQLGETSGGVELTSITYVDSMQGRPEVHFFFNPGECTLN
jgi:hypothetical protein